GETKHGLVMGHTVFQAIVQLEMEYLKPIGLGILGPEIESHQIEKRLEPYAEKAVLAVYTMLKIKKDIYEKEE
ncbi:MAG: 6,7-dimethyl-8-ribityllumazine synthase, partial [Planctomycetota bacterium]